MAKYIEQHPSCDALQFNSVNRWPICAMLQIPNFDSFTTYGHGIDPSDGRFKITTSSGIVEVNENDWIVCHPVSGFSVCTAEAFELCFKPYSPYQDFYY